MKLAQIVPIILAASFCLRQTAGDEENTHIQGLVEEEEDDKATPRDKEPEDIKFSHDKEYWQLTDERPDFLHKAGIVGNETTHEHEAKASSDEKETADSDRRSKEPQDMENEITISDGEGDHTATPMDDSDSHSGEKEVKEQSSEADSEWDKGSKRENDGGSRMEEADEQKDDKGGEDIQPPPAESQREFAPTAVPDISKEGTTEPGLGRQLNEEDEQISAVNHELATTDKVELEPPRVDEIEQETQTNGETRSIEYLTTHSRRPVDPLFGKFKQTTQEMTEENDSKRNEEGRYKSEEYEHGHGYDHQSEKFQHKSKSFRKQSEESLSGKEADSYHEGKMGRYLAGKGKGSRLDDLGHVRPTERVLKHMYGGRKSKLRDIEQFHKKDDFDKSKFGDDYFPMANEKEYVNSEKEMGYDNARKHHQGPHEMWQPDEDAPLPKQSRFQPEGFKKMKDNDQQQSDGESEIRKGHEEADDESEHQRPYGGMSKWNKEGGGSSSSYSGSKGNDQGGSHSEEMEDGQGDKKESKYDDERMSQQGDRHGEEENRMKDNEKEEHPQLKKHKGEERGMHRPSEVTDSDAVKAPNPELDALEGVKDDQLKLELENESLQTEVQTLQDEDQNVKDVLKGAEDFEEKEKDGPLSQRDEMKGPSDDDDNNGDDVKSIIDSADDKDPYGYFSSLRKAADLDERGEKKEVVRGEGGKIESPSTSRSFKKAIKATISHLLGNENLDDPFPSDDEVGTDIVIEKGMQRGFDGKENPFLGKNGAKMSPEEKRKHVQSLLLKFFSDKNRTREFIRCAVHHHCEGLRQLGRRTHSQVLNDNVQGSDDNGKEAINLVRWPSESKNASNSDISSLKRDEKDKGSLSETPFSVSNEFNTKWDKNESKVFHEVIVNNKTVNKSEGESALKHKKHLWEKIQKQNNKTSTSNGTNETSTTGVSSTGSHPFITENTDTKASQTSDAALNTEPQERMTNEDIYPHESKDEKHADVPLKQHEIKKSNHNKIENQSNKSNPSDLHSLPKNNNTAVIMFNQTEENDFLGNEKQTEPPEKGITNKTKIVVIDQALVKQDDLQDSWKKSKTNFTLAEPRIIKGTLKTTVPKVETKSGVQRKNFSQHEMTIIQKMYHQIHPSRHHYKLGAAFKRTLGSRRQQINKRTFRRLGWHHFEEPRRLQSGKGQKKDDLPEGLTGAISYTNRDGKEFIYAIGSEQLTWGESRVKCQSHGGDLISIGDKEEQEFVTTNVIAEEDRYWIGFTDQVHEGIWEWTDGTPTRYSNWSNLEPDDGTIKTGEITHNEDCAVMNPNHDWSDVPCWSRFRYICKIFPGCGHAISFGGQLSYTDVGNGTGQDFTFKEHKFNPKKPKGCSPNFPLTPPVPGAYPQPSAYPLSTAGHAMPPPAAAPQIQISQPTIVKLPSVPNNAPNTALPFAPGGLPPPPVLQTPPHVQYPQIITPPVDRLNPLMRSALNEPEQASQLKADENIKDDHHGPTIVTPPPPSNAPPPAPPAQSAPPPPRSTTAPPPETVQPAQSSPAPFVAKPPPASAAPVAQPIQQPPNDKVKPVAPAPQPAMPAATTYNQPAANALPSPDLSQSKNAANLNSKVASEGTMKEGVVGVGSSGKEGEKAPVFEGTDIKLGGSPLYGNEVDNVSPGGNGGPSVLGNGVPPGVAVAQNSPAVSPLPPPPPPPPPPVMPPQGDSHVDQDYHSHDGEYFHPPGEPLRAHHHSHPNGEPFGIDNGPIEDSYSNRPSSSHEESHGHSTDVFGGKPETGPIPLYPGKHNEKPDGMNDIMPFLPQTLSEKLVEKPLASDKGDSDLQDTEHLTTAQKMAMANTLAAEIAPELVKDYSVRFAPDIDVVKSICGKMCGDTAASICMGNPKQVGVVCGRLCAETLLKMSPVEVLNVMNGMKSINSVSSMIAHQSAASFCPPDQAKAAADTEGKHAGHIINGPDMDTHHPDALADSHFGSLPLDHPKAPSVLQGPGLHSDGNLGKVPAHLSDDILKHVGGNPALIDDATAELLASNGAIDPLSITDLKTAESPVGHLDADIESVSVPGTYLKVHRHPHSGIRKGEHLRTKGPITDECVGCHHRRPGHKVVSFINNGPSSPLSVHTDILSGTYHALVNSIEPEVINSLVSSISNGDEPVSMDANEEFAAERSTAGHNLLGNKGKSLPVSKHHTQNIKTEQKQDGVTAQEYKEKNQSLLSHLKNKEKGAEAERGNSSSKIGSANTTHRGSQKLGKVQLTFDTDVSDEDQSDIIHALQEAAIKEESKKKWKPRKYKYESAGKEVLNTEQDQQLQLSHHISPSQSATLSQMDIKPVDNEVHDINEYHSHLVLRPTWRNKPTDYSEYFQELQRQAYPTSNMQSDVGLMMGGAEGAFDRFPNREQTEGSEAMALTRLAPKQADNGPMSLGYVSAFESIANQFSKRERTPAGRYAKIRKRFGRKNNKQGSRVRKKNAVEKGMKRHFVRTSTLKPTHIHNFYRKRKPSASSRKAKRVHHALFSGKRSMVYYPNRRQYFRSKVHRPSTSSLEEDLMMESGEEAGEGMRRRQEIDATRTVIPLKITVKSVGCFDPPYHGSQCEDNTGSIVVNGIEHSPNQQGFNFVIIDFRSGDIEKGISFNTHGDAGAHKKMSKLIESLGDWKIVAVAVKEDGKNYLPSSALEDMRKIGAKDLISNDLEYRAAYALVGFSGPADIRDKLPWIREEVSKAGKGPSVISVNVKAGMAPFVEYGGVIEPPSPPPPSEDKSNEDELANTKNDNSSAESVTGQNRNPKDDGRPRKNTDAEYTGSGPNGSTEQTDGKYVNESSKASDSGVAGTTLGQQSDASSKAAPIVAAASQQPMAAPSQVIQASVVSPSSLQTVAATPVAVTPLTVQAQTQQVPANTITQLNRAGNAITSPGSLSKQKVVEGSAQLVPGTISLVPPSNPQNVATSTGTIATSSLPAATSQTSAVTQKLASETSGATLSAAPATTLQASAPALTPLANSAQQHPPLEGVAKSANAAYSNTPGDTNIQVSLTARPQNMLTSLPVSSQMIGTRTQDTLPQGSNVTITSFPPVSLPFTSGQPGGAEGGDPNVSQKITALMFNISTLQKLIEKNAAAQANLLNSALAKEGSSTTSQVASTSTDSSTNIPSDLTPTDSGKASLNEVFITDKPTVSSTNESLLAGLLPGDNAEVPIPGETGSDTAKSKTQFADLTDAQNLQLQQQGVMSHTTEQQAIDTSDAAGTRSNNNYISALQSLNSQLNPSSSAGSVARNTAPLSSDNNVSKLIALADALGYGKDASSSALTPGPSALSKLLAIADALGMKSPASSPENALPSLYNTVPDTKPLIQDKKIEKAKPKNSDDSFLKNGEQAKLFVEAKEKGALNPEVASSAGLQSALDALNHASQEASSLPSLNRDEASETPIAEVGDAKPDDADATIESQITAALSTLGIPDAAASGIASLMSPAITATKAENKKDSDQKLGLASKLAKSIADLGGRGAASAAGIASLTELLKDNNELTTTKATDKLGQALQRVGGAGAAVGYAALAAALKEPASASSAGALVANLVMSLAEQGSAPGTAGLAALAAGLGGSGADALAGGLGGSLENLPAAENAKAVSTDGVLEANENKVAPVDASSEAITSQATLGDAPKPTKSPVESNLEGLGGEVEVHPASTDAEYTGQGPIGSREQGGFLEIGLGTSKNNPLATIAASLLRGAKLSSSRSKAEDSSPRKTGCSDSSSCHDRVQEEGMSSLSETDNGSETDHEPSKSHSSDPLRLFSTADLGLIGNSLGSLSSTKPKEESKQEEQFSRRCTARCRDETKQVGLLIELRSTQKAASIKVNERDLSKDEPGFNIVVIDFSTGEVEATENFDTENDGGASRAMANFLLAMRPGKIILVASKGEASNNIDSSAYKALDSCGGHILKTSLLQRGDKYVLLGFKGPEVDWTREVLAEAGGGTALLSMPLMIGPAALKNKTLCLQLCKHNEENGVLLPQGQENFSEETSYADIGSSRKSSQALGSDVALKRNQESKVSDNDDDALQYSKFVVLPVRKKYRGSKSSDTDQAEEDQLDPDDVNEKLDEKMAALEKERKTSQEDDETSPTKSMKHEAHAAKPLRKQKLKHKNGQKKKVIAKHKPTTTVSSPAKTNPPSSKKAKATTKKLKGAPKATTGVTPEILNASLIDFSQFDSVLKGYSKNNNLAGKAILLNYDLGDASLSPKGVTNSPPNEGLDFRIDSKGAHASSSTDNLTDANGSKTKFGGGELVQVQNETSSNDTATAEQPKGHPSDNKSSKGKSTTEGASALSAVYKSAKKDQGNEKEMDINEKSYAEIGDLLYSRSDQPRPLEIQVIQPRSKVYTNNVRKRKRVIPRRHIRVKDYHKE